MGVGFGIGVASGVGSGVGVGEDLGARVDVGVAAGGRTGVAIGGRVAVGVGGIGVRVAVGDVAGVGGTAVGVGVAGVCVIGAGSIIGVIVSVGSAVATDNGVWVGSVGIGSGNSVGTGSGDAQASTDATKDRKRVAANNNRRHFEFIMGLHAIFRRQLHYNRPSTKILSQNRRIVSSALSRHCHFAPTLTLPHQGGGVLR